MPESDGGRQNGGSEEVPEALLALQQDLQGLAVPSRWRAAAADVAGLDFVGPGRWKQVGPDPLVVSNQQIFQGIGPNSGEVVDIAIDPRGDSRTIYLATGNGGLWKSVDGGTSWAPLTDLLEYCVSAVAIDPGDPDTVYAGTGNLFSGAGGMAKAGGLLQSRDAGATWSRLSTPAVRPPQVITKATNLPNNRLALTIPGHGYSSGVRVVMVGLPGIVGADGETLVFRTGDDTLRVIGHLNAAYAGGATLYDASGAPFLCDVGVNRIVCPAPGTVLVGTEAGLFYSETSGRSFGANAPAFDDGLPIRHGFVSALSVDSGWTRTQRITAATPASPVVCTVPGHGFQNGDHVFVGGTAGLLGADGGWLVDRLGTDTFSLRGSTGSGATSTQGFVVGPGHPVTLPVQDASNPAAPGAIVVTSPAHGLITGDVVAISGVQGNLAANGSWSVRVQTADKFELVGSRGSGAAVPNTGSVDAPAHRAPVAITAADDKNGVLTLTVPAHGLVDGDRVSFAGLPGISAPRNSAAVHVEGPDTIRVTGLHMNALYGGAGATMAGPADAWNTAYFAISGRADDGDRPSGGLFRLTVTSTGPVVISDNLLRHPGGVPPQFGRISFGQSVLPRTNTLYAMVQDRDGRQAIFLGLFHSDDWGRTWNLRPRLGPLLQPDNLTQTTYDFTLGVDPQQPDTVYAGLQQLWRSNDAGRTFATPQPGNAGGVERELVAAFGKTPSTMQLHWDHHALVFPPATQWPAPVPAAPPAPQLPSFTPVYLGTDGGITLATTTSTANHVNPMAFQHLNEGLATSLFRGIDIGRGAGANGATFGGMQDTGTAGHRSSDASTAWSEGVDGDGSPVAVDPLDPDIVYGFHNSMFTRTTNGGRTWFSDGLTQRAGINVALPVVRSVENEDPIRVVTTGHTFVTGDRIIISGVTSGGRAAALPNGVATVTVLDNNEFTLNGKNAAAAPAFDAVPTANSLRYLDQATISGVTATSPITVQTAIAHGCATGQKVRIDGVQGVVQANNTDANPTWTVTRDDDTHLTLQGSVGAGAASYVPGTGRLSGPGRPDDVPIVFTTNANPMVVVAQGHGFMSGDTAQVSLRLRPTGAAPVAPTVLNAPIRVIDANSFEMTGTTGVANPLPAPTASGRTIGRGQPADEPDFLRVVACRAAAPAAGEAPTTVFVSRDRQLFRSTDRGVTFKRMNMLNDSISALHATVDNRLWVGTSGAIASPPSGLVRFSTDGGKTFVSGDFVNSPGARGPISSIHEDPAVATGNRVAVVVAGYSQTATQRRTRHCFVTETGGHSGGSSPAWKEVGGTAGAAHGNLPDVPLLGVGWDTSSAPSTLLAATEFGVLRLGPANVWQRVGANLPTISCQSIAIDASVPQPVIRIGTYGRSAWELAVPATPSLHVEADLGFGDWEVMSGAGTRRLVLHSLGTADVVVSAIDGTGGDFALSASPSGAVTFPLTVASGTSAVLNLSFTPSATGVRSTTLAVHSNDPERPTVSLPATGSGVAIGQSRLAVGGVLDFGVVATAGSAELTLDIANVGTASLMLDTLQPGPGDADFTLVAPVPKLPFPVAAGASTQVTVRFAPTADGDRHGSVIVGSGAGAEGRAVSLTGRGTTSIAGAVNAVLVALGLSGPDTPLLD